MCCNPGVLAFDKIFYKNSTINTTNFPGTGFKNFSGLTGIGCAEIDNEREVTRMRRVALRTISRGRMKFWVYDCEDLRPALERIASRRLSFIPNSWSVFSEWLAYLLISYLNGSM